MAIFDEPRVQITIIGVQGTQITNTVLFYHTDETGVGRSAEQCAVWFQTAYEVGFLECCSEQWEWVETEAYAWTGTVFETYLDFVGAAGLVTGDAMPMYNSFNISKYPDNTTLDPPEATPFKRGRIAMPGMPESFQNGNIPNATGLAEWDALATALLSFDINGVDYVQHMFRAANVVGAEPKAATNVLQLQSNKLGTQNTRKP